MPSIRQIFDFIERWLSRIQTTQWMWGLSGMSLGSFSIWWLSAPPWAIVLAGIGGFSIFLGLQIGISELWKPNTESEQLQRKEIQRILAEYVEHGSEIRDRFDILSLGYALEARERWERQIENYLLNEKRLGQPYCVRFRNPTDSPLVKPGNSPLLGNDEWQDMGRKINMLLKFIEEFNS